MRRAKILKKHICLSSWNWILNKSFDAISWSNDYKLKRKWREIYQSVNRKRRSTLSQRWSCPASWYFRSSSLHYAWVKYLHQPSILNIVISTTNLLLFSVFFVIAHCTFVFLFTSQPTVAAKLRQTFGFILTSWFLEPFNHFEGVHIHFSIELNRQGFQHCKLLYS